MSACIVPLWGRCSLVASSRLRLEAFVCLRRRFAVGCSALLSSGADDFGSFSASYSAVSLGGEGSVHVHGERTPRSKFRDLGESFVEASLSRCHRGGLLDEVSVGFDARRWLYVANSCFKLEKESRKKLGITPKPRGLKPLAGDAPPIFGHCHRSGTESRSVTALHN